MSIEYIDPISDSRWLKFIEQHGEANIFHHPKWLSVLNSQYNFKVSAVCAVQNNIITAGIPFCEIFSLTRKRKLVSLPFSDYSSPLYNSGKDIQEVYSAVRILFKTNKISAIEIFNQTSHNAGFIQMLNSYKHFLTIKDSEDEMMKSFDRTKRQGIAKAEKQGLEVVLSNELDAVLGFFELHLGTRKSKGIPVQPVKFFTNIYDLIIADNLGFVITVKKDGLNIAAGLFMHYNNVLTYKYNASDARYQNLRPNNLIIWRALQEGIKNGFRVFDFGKTDLCNEGLRSFKMGFGAVELPNSFSYYPELPGKGLFDTLKDRIVAPVIKTCPGFVCQAIGEVGYKFFPSI